MQDERAGGAQVDIDAVVVEASVQLVGVSDGDVSWEVLEIVSVNASADGSRLR
jgi:hypothetical protein